MDIQDGYIVIDVLDFNKLMIYSHLNISVFSHYFANQQCEKSVSMLNIIRYLCFDVTI